ncbi:hypothetical protein [Acuticoccus sp.]|uniref:hypothetical protein n=1 Tax=Acuticoccus sp. TaxID=1904378 RepID=UPI003B52FCE6
MAWAQLAAVAFLATVHLGVQRLFVLDRLPRSRWLSFAGGAAVAYVFLHILPELATHQDTLASSLGLGARGAEEVVYALAMAGLVVFYALERMIRARPDHPDGSRVHLASFALYNVLIGYLVFHREEAGAVSLALYVAAMAFHFLTVDHGLRQHHAERYDRWGRWVLVAALVGGATLGALTQVPEWAVAGPFALLAGSVLLNTLKEELPEEQQSRLVPFVAGAAGYGALLIAL